MAWNVAVYSIPPLVATGVSLLLAVYVWRYREEILARAFIVLMVAVAAWSVTYAIQLGYASEAEQLFWFRLGQPIGATIPVIWLFFAAVYAGRLEWFDRRVLGLLLLDPMAFALLAVTNGDHHLLWTSAGLMPGPSPGLDVRFTPLYYAHVAYAYLIVLIGIGILVAVFLRASAIYRRQSGLLVLGAVVPLSANAAFTAGLGPMPGLDLTTSTFALSGAIFALALFRFDLLNLTPVARQRLISELGGGLLVARRDGRLVSVNETARRVLPTARVGEDVREVLSVRDVSTVHGLVSSVEVDGERRFHEFRVSPLSDYRGRPVGNVVVLRDVTERREYEQRLEVANRLLRHNLRNDMSLILGWAEEAAEDAEGEALAALERIEAVAEDVAEMGRKAKRIETTLEAREGDLVTVDAVSVLDSIVTDLREAWPAASIELAVPDAAPVRAPGDGLVDTAFRNVVENAIEHSDRKRPRVEIEVSEGTGPNSDGRWTSIIVSDNGSGIPRMERNVLLSGKETALQHGSGLGLWLVRWITETAGGELEFTENEPRGSVVTIRLRPA